MSVKPAPANKRKTYAPVDEYHVSHPTALGVAPEARLEELVSALYQATIDAQQHSYRLNELIIRLTGGGSGSCDGETKAQEPRGSLGRLETNLATLQSIIGEMESHINTLFSLV